VRSGKNEGGNYSRIKWDSIMPPPKSKKSSEAEDLDGVDVESLDMRPDAPDFSDLGKAS
jgi:hypothetical protein